MESRKIWTAKEAQGSFERLLDAARDAGPQEIQDDTGTYELRVKLDRTKGDAVDFLARRS